MKIYREGPETERLILRAFEPKDFRDFHRLNSHPKVMEHTDEPPCPSLKTAKAQIEAYPDFEKYGFGRWACVLKGEKKVIGFAGLKFLPEREEIDLGYRFLPEHWGKGLATEASQASIDFGFNILKLKRIIGLVLPKNKASIRVLEKVGMKKEGWDDFESVQALRYAITR